MSKKEKPNSKKRKKNIIRLSIILTTVAVLTAVGIIFIPGLLNANDAEGTILQKRTAVVTEGDIVKTIGASAPVESSEKTDVRPDSASEVVEILVENGDYVSEGSIVMILDTSSTDSSIEALEEQVENKQNQIEDKQELIEDRYDSIDGRREDISDKKEDIAELNDDISDLEDEIDDNEGNRADLNIYAPIDGTIFNLKVSVGDIVSANTVFAVVTDTVSYEVEIPFSADFTEHDIQDVTVIYKNDAIQSKIVSYADYTYKDQFNNVLVDVIIAFTTDISLPEKSTVKATITAGDTIYRSKTDTAPYFADTENITSDISGEILELFLNEKQSVEKGDLVAVIDGDSIDSKTDSLNSQIESVENQIDSLNDFIDAYYSNIDSYYEDITDLNEDIDSLNEDIAELQDEIDEAKEDYEDAKITADFSGIVSDIKVSAGDSVNVNATLFTLTNMENPNMVVAIDELDIAEITEGLEATVVIDALSETEKTPVTAVVTDIALEGDYQGGVTTYDVTITLSGSVEGLRLSMNATATIFTGKSENTLYIPIEAVTMRNGKSFVYVEDASVTGTPADDIQSNLKQDSEAMTSNTDGTDAIGTGGGGGRGGRDISAMSEEELTAFKERLAAKGMTLDDVQNQTPPTGEDIAAESAALQDYYSGTRIVEVTTGIYNALYIEILDGLDADDTVVLPPLYTSANTSDSSATGGIMRIPGIPGSGGGTGRPGGLDGGSK